jgi:kynureninase
VKSAFEMIEEASMKEISAKAAKGTQMAIELFDQWLAPLGFSLNTPLDSTERGGHLSLVHKDAKEIAIAMREISKVIPDYRAPNSIRVAISPLINSYCELWDGFDRIRELVESKKYVGIDQGGSRVT